MVNLSGNDRVEVTYDSGKYEIVFADSFDTLADEAFKIKQPRKIGIITDSNVSGLYADTVKDILSAKETQVFVYVVPAGEENKNLDSVKKIYEFLIENRFDRKDMLIALGGGVIGDMTGFAAATYLRGVDYIQVPTTLLSMVDSSVGGKTGVDLGGYKNMVGAFYMPRLVFTNISTLKSLPKRQFASGMGEVLKAGLIKDGSFYGWIINNL
ncbi:MAG: 3-dehydroquinate synthase, partial [Lachnospiraceae bacterium]|nr:3-dehydroquinate synthase [Lachnospiraceae bacterium]